MLQIFHNTNFDFMGRRKIAYIFSSFMILVSAVSLIMHGGPRLGIDFTGGVMMQVRFAHTVPMDEVRRAIDEAGFSGTELQSVTGTNDIMIRIHQKDAGSNPFPRINGRSEERRV